MAGKCLICGAANATCGTPTTTLPVDARVTGYKVIGEKLVKEPTDLQAVLGEMNDDEREEFRVMMEASEGRKLRNQMAAGPRGHTYLAYVRCVDGVTRKMLPADADAYVEQFGDQEGVEIINKGDLAPPDPEAAPLGATKATVGPMFGEDGRQMADTQPLTTRSFMVGDITRNDVHTPAIGATGSDIDNDASVSSTGTAAPTARVPRAGVANRAPAATDENAEKS